MEIFDLLKLLTYIAAFWVFLLSPSARRRQMAAFRAAGIFGRGVLVFHGAVATLCGLLPIEVLGWLVFT